MHLRKIVITRGLCLAAFVLSPAAAHAVNYATITDVTATRLSNGIQINVRSDGVLEWSRQDSGDRDTRVGSKITLRFGGARSAVKNYIDVSQYPVSYVQTSVAPGAKEGVGVIMTIGLYARAQYDISESPNRQSVIITVESDRNVTRVPAPRARSTSDQESDLVCEMVEGELSVSALKSGMLEVFGEIARVSGLNVVVDDALERRTVSMSLKASPEEVVRGIASAYGLALLDNKGVFLISEGVPTDLATYRLSGTQSFPMKYVRAQTASSLLPAFLYSYLHVNGEQNAVVVTAPSQMLEKIGTDLGKVDIAPPQIMIEALAVEVSSNTDLMRAIRFQQNESGSQTTLNTQTGDINYTTLGELPAGWQATVRALSAESKANIHANPRMAVMNGHEASIFIGAQRFIRVEYSDYGTKVTRIQGVDVGTKIEVVPWTGGNGEITVTIAPEVSNVVELDRESGLPTLSSRRAGTTVRVKDGETIVIGGLKQRQSYDTRRKVPILGDLPLVGNLFRSRSAQGVDTELLIFVTPRILTPDGHLPLDEETRIKQRMLQEPQATPGS